MGYIHCEPFNVLLKFTELSLSRFWPTSLEAAQPCRKYSSDDQGLYWWDFATSLSELDLELSFGPSYDPALTMLVNSKCFPSFITVRFLSLLCLNLLIIIREKLSPVEKYSRLYSQLHLSCAGSGQAQRNLGCR